MGKPIRIEGIRDPPHVSVPPPDARRKLSVTAFRKGEGCLALAKYDEAFRHFIEASALSHPLAQLFLERVACLVGTVEQQDYFSSVGKEWLTEAERGLKQSAILYYKVGYCFEHGIGTDVNHQQKTILYETCCRMGLPAGFHALGRAIETDSTGGRYEANDNLAAALYQKGADQQDPQCALQLSLLTTKTAKSREDVAHAQSCLRQAAALGDPEAMAGVATALFCSKDTELLHRQEETAFRYARRAATAGLVRGVVCMGHCYRLGIVVPRDTFMAAAWFNRAIQTAHHWDQEEEAKAASQQLTNVSSPEALPVDWDEQVRLLVSSSFL